MASFITRVEFWIGTDIADRTPIFLYAQDYISTEKQIILPERNDTFTYPNGDNYRCVSKHINFERDGRRVIKVFVLSFYMG